MRAFVKWLICASVTLMAVVGLQLQQPVSAQEVVVTSEFPPLGSFIRQLRTETRPGATAYSMWTTNSDLVHQVWFRIKGGDAQFIQRLQVYRENALPRPDDELPPAERLVEEIPTNAPTSWYVLPPERAIYTYYIDGDHVRFQEGLDEANGRGVSVVQSRYERGSLFEIRFEDRATLDDYNDLEVEVAFIQ